MKKYFLLIVLVCIITCLTGEAFVEASDERWRLAGKNEFEVVMVDRQSLHRTEQDVIFCYVSMKAQQNQSAQQKWHARLKRFFEQNNIKAEPEKVDFILQAIVFNEKDYQYREINIMFYGKDKKQIASIDGNKSWKMIVPNTESEKIYLAAQEILKEKEAK